MIAAIHQPNYLPWLGYFNKMARSDVFVLLDDVQLVRGKSFVTRNKVKTPGGDQWLTVPVKGKSELVLIKDAVISQDGKWQQKHWRTIQLSYKKAPFFDRYEEKLGEIYQHPWQNLAELNISLIKVINNLLGINTGLIRSSEMNIENTGAEKILSILRRLGADQYISGEGKGSERYIAEDDFRENSIELIYQQFEHPVYNQLWGDFISNLSVIDLLFNEGEKSLGILARTSPDC